MARMFWFLIGFGFSVLGFVYIIGYLNLMSLGYNLKEYAHFIVRRPECLIGVAGLGIIFLTIFLPKGDKDELRL